MKQYDPLTEQHSILEKLDLRLHHHGKPRSQTQDNQFKRLELTFHCQNGRQNLVLLISAVLQELNLGNFTIAHYELCFTIVKFAS